MPASSSAWSSSRPAGPTNGRPSRSSRSPGCSPTSIRSAAGGPSPKTVCVPTFQSGQARQSAAASRSVTSLSVTMLVHYPGPPGSIPPDGGFRHVPSGAMFYRRRSARLNCGKDVGGSMSGTEHAAPSATLSRVRLAAVARPDALARADALVESYRGLADVFREVLSEQSLDALLERIADTVGALVPYDELVIYEADAARRRLVPVLVRSKWAQEIVDDEAAFGVGITGWAVENREPVHTNEAHLDPRVRIVQGTPVDPEALIVVPLIARGELKGALNIYRVGDDAEFDADEFELAKRFGDAAALALDNAKSRAQLEHQAQTDALTGLLNHRYFHERLRAELQRASRSHLPLGLLMLDIDDFKRVNDIHGHAAGDEVLVRLADSLRGSARGSDVVCRIGGEEFAVILPETDANSASQLAIRMRQRMAAHAVEGLGELTVSIGFAEGPADASSPCELVACPEAAMMTAKASGKNRIVHFGEGNHERPDAAVTGGRDGRSIGPLNLLQSPSGKLNPLTAGPARGLA